MATSTIKNNVYSATLLNNRMGLFHGSVSGSSSVNYTLAKGSLLLLISNSAVDSLKGIFIISSGASSGTLDIVKMSSESGGASISCSSSAANTLTVTNGNSNTAASLDFLILNGSITL